MIKSLGSRLTLCVAMSSTVVRCVLYTIATEPWQVVAIQLLHGVSWVCIWSGGTAFAHEMAPPHLKSTAQGILNSVYGGV
jgi:predicted MFS family arabinose efflux permease